MPLIRRTRGALLRLVRRRGVSISLGALLAIPAAWIEVGSVHTSWWIEGLSLIVCATGLALFWTGLTGPSPDWVE